MIELGSDLKNLLELVLECDGNAMSEKGSKSGKRRTGREDQQPDVGDGDQHEDERIDDQELEEEEDGDDDDDDEEELFPFRCYQDLGYPCNYKLSCSSKFKSMQTVIKLANFVGT